MRKANYEIRKALQRSGVTHRQLSEALGIRHETLSRKLRTELQASEKNKILSLIVELEVQNDLEELEEFAKEVTKNEIEGQNRSEARTNKSNKSSRLCENQCENCNCEGV